MYNPILLSCQMHTEYTVSAHEIYINFQKVFGGVRKMYGQLSATGRVYSSKCGIHFIRIVIAQWSKAQVCNLLS